MTSDCFKKIDHLINLSRNDNMSLNIFKESYIPVNLKYFYAQLRGIVQYIIKANIGNEFDLYEYPQIKKTISNQMNILINVMSKLKKHTLTTAEYVFTFVKGLEFGRYINDDGKVDFDTISDSLQNTKHKVFIFPGCEIRIIDLWIYMNESHHIKICDYLSKMYFHGKRYIRKSSLYHSLQKISDQKKIYKFIISNEKEF
jgi:hypothetical protein